MTATWSNTPRTRWWTGRDPAKPKYHLQVWAGGHVATWSLSTDERRIAHGDSETLEAAKAAAEAALDAR